MKIAIVDHYVNYGGGSRVLRCLLPAIRKLRPDWQIDFFANRCAITRDGLEEEFERCNIKIKGLKSAKLANTKFFFGLRGARTIITFAQRKFKKPLSFLPLYFSGAVHREIAQISKNYDLLFLPWPYHVQCPELSCPVVSIFHDFNYRYYFNGPTWHPFILEDLQRDIPNWLRISTPVVSTHFMKQELEKFYPEFKGKAKVIHLSSLGAQTKIDFAEAKKVIDEMGIKGQYLIYATNTSTHKNIGNLISAFYLLRKKYPDLKLILAGYGTEAVNGKAEALGLEIGNEDRNVFGLGYITNLQMDALIQCAEAVISTSLYEAGCGPGLDAWLRAVPVAMSNIPPFVEHMEVQGVRAQVFDPKSPSDIAEKIDFILTHPEQAKADALHSQKKLAEYQWEQVAQKYIDVFEGAKLNR
jgi:glycosyltransferase involved in cell wall biosynthesis